MAIKQSTSKKSLPKRFRLTVLSEAPYLLIVASGMVIEFAHIVKTSWLNILLYDPDSLTLPILRQSLAHKDSIQWVFSAQLNLFPEGILYVIASVLTTSIRASIVMYAVLDVLAFYFILRLLLKIISRSSIRRQRIISTVLTSLLIVYMLLEAQTGIIYNQDSATYFLFSTYYSGVLLMGLLSVCGVLQQIKTIDYVKQKSNLIISIAIVVLTALTVASNPLYVIQFSLPIMAISVLMSLLSLMSRKKLIIILLPQIIGLMLGLALRSFLQPFIGQSLGYHTSGSLSLSTTRTGLLLFLDTLSPYHATFGMKLRLYLGILTFYVVLLRALMTLNNRFRGRKQTNNPLILFTLLFAAAEPIIVFVILLLANSIQGRYFIAPLILPIVGLVAFADVQISVGLKQVATKVLLLTSALLVIAGLLCIPTSSRIVSSAYPNEACLQAGLSYKPADGVGDYYTSRSLDVYNTSNERVLQIWSDYDVYPWLSNLSSYEGKDFTFIAVDKRTNIYDVGAVTLTSKSATPRGLGAPSKVIDCPDFYIYQYPPGTKGYTTLNEHIHQSLKRDIILRTQGKLSAITSR